MEENKLTQYFASKLKEIRVANGLTQKEFGEKLGLSDAAITMYEKGKREPKKALLYEIAEMFHVPIDYFFPPVEGTEVQEPEYDEDSLEILEMLGRNPDLKILFKKTGKLSEKDKEQVVRILQATLPPSHED